MALLLKNYVPDTFQKLVNDLLEENMYQPEKKRTYVPKADIMERDADFEIQLVMPGLNKENISLHIDKGVLTVSAELENKETDENEAKEHVVYHLRERVYGPYQRSFQLPDNIKEDKIKAGYENGILTINLQKERTKPVKKSIKVN
jgi:HSP20 family protein